MTRRHAQWLRLAAGAVVLAVLGVRLGSAPVLAGVRAASTWSLAVALVLTAATTWCCARRWSLVADRFGRPLRVGTAYAAYYRSQLVNATLPGGVVGDVGRAVTHGPRPVVWERAVGQAVQLALAAALLVVVPSPLRWTAAPVALALLATVAVAVVVRRDLRRLLPAAGPLLALSAGSFLGHLLVFLAAAAAVGTSLPAAQLVALGALALVASAIPVNLAGWGPREGVTAWAFATAGAGAATGLTVSVAFGVMSLVATLPGLLTLLPPARRSSPARGVVAHG
jgi:hypothetical protein